MSSKNRERDRRQRRGRRAFAQPAIGFDQNAARQHIKHRDHAERGEAFELAMTVMMLGVGGAIGKPHHQPGDDSRRQIDRTVQGFGNQRETADRDPDHEFRGRHAGAGKDRDRGDTGLGVVKGRVHGRGFSSPPCNIKAPTKRAIATHLQQQSCELFPLQSSPEATASRQSCRDAGWLPCGRRPCRCRRMQTPCRSAIAVCAIPPPARYPCELRRRYRGFPRSSGCGR